MSQNCGSEPGRRKAALVKLRHTSVAMVTINPTKSQKGILFVFVQLIRH